MQEGTWANVQGMAPRNFTCGHEGCGREVASERGWYYQRPGLSADAWIYVCPGCRCPTFFHAGMQVPGVSLGSKVDHLPQVVKELYEEARKVTSQGAHTSAVMACRKILMHVAVEKGAAPNQGFVAYVDHLVNNRYVPPNSQPWVDRIRAKGNEANHEIKLMGQQDASETLGFVEMLLKFIYEFPGKVAQTP